MKQIRTQKQLDALCKTGVAGWLEAEGVEGNAGKVILYKRVSKDFKTQEDAQNETEWEVGKTLTHPCNIKR